MDHARVISGEGCSFAGRTGIDTPALLRQIAIGATKAIIAGITMLSRYSQALDNADIPEHTNTEIGEFYLQHSFQLFQ